MTGLPRDYDAWRLASPDDEREACRLCANTGDRECPDCDGHGCIECDGDGTVPCYHEAPDDEPDGDYLYERKRDEGFDK